MYKTNVDIFARENRSGKAWTWAYKTEVFLVDVPINDNPAPRNKSNVADYDAVNDKAIEAAKKSVELTEMFEQFFRDLKEEADKSPSMTYTIAFSVKEKGDWGDELNTAVITLRYGMCLAYNACLEPFPTTGEATAILAVVKAISAAYRAAV